LKIAPIQENVDCQIQQFPHLVATFTAMKTVLLVEDESTFQMIGKILLRTIGLPPENFYSAQTGKEALELLDKLHATGKPLPELILLDVFMPIMDGFGFLEAYSKKNYAGKEHVTIIALTSSQDPRDMERMKEFGVTKYMTKPLEEGKIRAELGI
jgi:CheY-like chemotaxis protein